MMLIKVMVTVTIMAINIIMIAKEKIMMTMLRIVRIICRTIACVRGVDSSKYFIRGCKSYL